MKYSQSKTFADSMGGATLVEVMISVFLLTFGILALMAAQIRSVASVSEAANRTLISQAAEALSEGMQANPGQTKDAATNQLERNYTAYLKGVTTPDANNTAVTPLSDIRQTTKAALMQAQINNFEAALNAVPDVQNLAYAICADVADATPNAPTMSNAGVMDAQCAGGDAVYIKVAWQVKNPNGSDTADPVTHTYMYKATN